jgi:hypothetical protein
VGRTVPSYVDQDPIPQEETTMALKLTVGVSRKLGLPNYSSVGASCNIEVELDSGLLQGDLDGFHARVREAYVACQQAVCDELARLQSQPALSAAPHGAPANGHDRQISHEHVRAHSSAIASRTNDTLTRSVKPATASQVKLICAIARTQDADLEGLLREEYHVDHPEDLTLSQASALIDQLKAVSAR